MRAHAQTLLHERATAATRLAGIGRIHRDHPTPSVHCFGFEDGAKLRPAGITDALGQVVVPYHIGDLQVFQIDRVVGPEQRQRRLVVEVLSLASHPLMRLGQQGHRLAPRHTSVRGLEGALGLSVPARIEDAGPIRQGGE